MAPGHSNIQETTALEARLRAAALYYLSRFSSSEKHLADILEKKTKRWRGQAQKAADMANSEANQGNADAPTQNAKKRPGKKHRAILDASQAQITAAIDAVVAECRRLGLVDDLRYAMGRAQTLARRGMSPMRIRQDLRFRGARDPIIAEVLEELAAGEAEVFAFDAARSYARRRRFGPYRSGAKDKGETNPAVLAKRELASMMRAGHRFELANAILGCDDRDQLEDAMNIDDIR